MNSYDLSRNFWNWSFDNPELISPNHSAIYFFAIEHCNRLGWKEKFGFPSQMTMDAIGIKKNRTYMKYFNELVIWGFFKLVQKSKNQYSANIISLVSATPKKGKALDKALARHGARHGTKHLQGKGQSNGTVDKQVNKLTFKQRNNEQVNSENDTDIEIYPTFQDFWNGYDKKVGPLEKIKKKYTGLNQDVKEKIMSHIFHYVKATPDKKFRLNPETFLNQKSWENEIINQNGKGITDQERRHEYFSQHSPNYQNI